jgi:hydrogenase maturation protease
MSEAISIICFGNELYGDDGIGPAVISELEKIVLPINAELIFGGNDGFLLIDLFEKGNKILVVDAVKMGKNPGEVSVFDLASIELNKIETHLTFHSFGFNEILQLIRELGMEPKAKVIGIEPYNLNFGQNLSPIVEKKIPDIVKEVIKECSSNDKKNISC